MVFASKKRRTLPKFKTQGERCGDSAQLSGDIEERNTSLVGDRRAASTHPCRCGIIIVIIIVSHRTSTKARPCTTEQKASPTFSTSLCPIPVYCILPGQMFKSHSPPGSLSPLGFCIYFVGCYHVTLVVNLLPVQSMT